MKNMKGKTVLVTGGGRDIGKACAIEFAKRGANVVLTYLSSAEEAKLAEAEVRSYGVEGLAIQADLTQQEEVDAVVNRAISQFGKIDSLIHVSGGLIDRVKINEMSDAHWIKVMDVNLTSLFRVTRACIPHIPTGGSIVTFSSQAGRDGGGAGAVAYATAKGAIMTFTRGLAKELGPDIRVNSVCPGMINTGFHDTFTNNEVRIKVAGATALKREGKAEEVAKLAAFLASDESSYMTGNCVDINAGLLFS
ncbi:SDR family oxidoreductase [Catenovulum sp. 2E275]|uniref:SDR family NAD(P)-dependent oxidoreductase n=1 Tax=Catenovulum sp. 2E275 TaxID=2980497 RepID=UPI0021D37A98|nr:SDR family oxidoreductase [Catenovulum sp. 2E275]MCU4674024.1 SDR family oxidoreductase [Catenovulum sp. 2E275]